MSSEINRYIGEAVRELRKAKHLTQEELANIIGFSRVNLANLETGKQRFNADVIYLLCCIFNVNPATLFPEIMKADIAKQPARTIVTKEYIAASLTVSG